MKFVIVASLLISFARPAHAQGVPNSALDQCETLAKQIAEKIGATIENRSSRDGEILLKVKNASELKIICSLANQKQSSIFITSNSAYPQAAFYKLLAEAGHVLTGLSLRRLNKGAHNCHRASAGDSNGRSNKGVRGLNFECHTSEKNDLSTFVFSRKSEHHRH